ncbi:MAG TPA: hypothetical protein VFV38_48250 [Ktedonobacteraceae bacterium]|nr:hypothetical protein [Ktedonobacteraceae bacterium]
MSEASAVMTTKKAVVKSIHWLRKLFTTIEAFLNKVSRILQQATGIVICLGGLFATAGWLLATMRPDPLGPTWNVSVWLVIVGSLLLVLGILALLSQHILRVGMIGQYGIIIFLLGAIVAIAGAFAVDLFILPWMAKLFAQFPNLGSVLQNGYNTVQSGVNSTVNTGSSLCNTITNPFGGSNSCSTSSTVVPNQQVPSLGVNDLLAQIGLPSLSSLGTLGLVFLSGAPLAPGCLLMAAVFLLAGVRPRSALLLVMLAAFLNLGGQFLLHLAFLGPFLNVLLFLSLAWFGFSLWSPWKLSLPGHLLAPEKAQESHS